MTTLPKALRVTQELKKKQKRQYLQEFKEEMQKISWTSKEELLICTKIVIGSTFLLGIGIYIIDLVLKSSIDSIHFILRMITG